MIDQADIIKAIEAGWWEATPHDFARHCSGGRFRVYDWHKYVGTKIADAVQRGNGRLMINVYPRIGKSWLSSYWTPTWFLHNYPDRDVLLTSYGGKQAAKWGRRVRNELARNPLLRTRLAYDAKAANQFFTTHGGSMMTAGVDGPSKGSGGHLVIIDDPHKTRKEVYSKSQRENVYEWYRSDILSRIEPNGTLIILTQRLHAEDLCGMILAEDPEPWELIRLPALAEANDPMGRAVGEALCPERHTANLLRTRMKEMGPEQADAQFQQAPRAITAGTLYKQFTDANLDSTLEFDPKLPLDLSIDFNSNPGMHMVLGQYFSREDRFTAVHEVHESRMDTRDAMDALARLLVDYDKHGRYAPLSDEAFKAGPKDRYLPSEVHIFGDPSGSSRSQQSNETGYQIVRAKLERMGYSPAYEQGHAKTYRIRVAKAHPSITDSVNVYNNILCDMDGARHYHVNGPRCPRLVDDLKHLQQDETGSIDKSDQELSHSSDAERYRLHYLRGGRVEQAKERPAGQYNVRAAS